MRETIPEPDIPFVKWVKYILAIILIGFIGVAGNNYIQEQRLIAKAEDGDRDAQFEVGRKLLIQTPIDPDDYNKGISWVIKAADQGQAQAQFVLGLIYKNDRTDNVSAVNWLLRALSNGEALAEKPLTELSSVVGIIKAGLLNKHSSVPIGNCMVTNLGLKKVVEESNPPTSSFLKLIYNDDYEAVKNEIISNGLDVDKSYSSGGHPLTAAASCSNMDIINLLLAAGAKPNIHAISAAVNVGDPKIADYLYSKAESLNPSAKDIETLYLMAILSSSPYEMIKWVVSHKFNPTYSLMPAWVMIGGGKMQEEQVIEKTLGFLLDSGLNPNSGDSDLLQMAVVSYRPAIVKLLLKHEAAITPTTIKWASDLRDSNMRMLQEASRTTNINRMMTAKKQLNSSTEIYNMLINRRN